MDQQWRFDPSSVFGTSCSIAGADFNSRLEINLSTEAEAIPSLAIHPFHPIGYAPKNREKDPLSKAL